MVGLRDVAYTIPGLRWFAELIELSSLIAIILVGSLLLNIRANRNFDVIYHGAEVI